MEIVVDWIGGWDGRMGKRREGKRREEKVAKIDLDNVLIVLVAARVNTS